jgi:hypothetical protein
MTAASPPRAAEIPTRLELGRNPRPVRLNGVRKEDNPVLTKIAALAPTTVIDGLRVFTVGACEHWIELLSGWNPREKLLVTCSDSELEDLINEVRAKMKHRQSC